MAKGMGSGDCHKGFASNYMLLLKPEEVGFLDLMHILFSPHLEEKRFVDRHESSSNSNNVDMEDSFRHRWLIFISLLLQKFLHFVHKPLASFGSSLEFCINLLSFNTNLFNLLLNFLTGKVVMPDRASANFLSIIGNLDKRVELDGSIKRKDSRYNAAISIMASKASYENVAYIHTTVQHHWKMEFLGFHDYWNEYQEKATTQGFIMLDKSEEVEETYVVAFRGTELFDADAWCSDFDISWYEIPGIGRMHGGFLKALGLQKNLGWPKEFERKPTTPVAYYAIRDLLRRRLGTNKKAKFILTGHSQGGALAILFVAILLHHDETVLLERLEGVYTFGQPRVGDDTFADYMEAKLKHHGIRYCRFVYCNDIVTRLPYDDKDLMFKHFGRCYYYDRHYQGRIVKEEPYKNYFSPLAVIPMTVNAFFELVRSFTIVYRNGIEYKEGWLLRFTRILGLFIPGISAHGPQDYVNATRLASLHH